ncbi:MAG TPA: GDSL-type esterase/lipase family protein [Pseudoxanthomonas sp.]
MTIFDAQQRRSHYLLVAAIGCALATATPYASAVLPKTAVVIGDSYASGEGGRWSGNSFTGINGGDRAGTDRAAEYTAGSWQYDYRVPYMDASIVNGCNRSNWAPITYLDKDSGLYPQGFDKVVNLACSGAKSKHLWPIADGGASFKGESPQIPRLSNVAANHDIDLIVIGVGGNDMGFAEVVERCAKAWIGKHTPLTYEESCVDQVNDHHLPKLGDVWYNLTKTIRLVHEQMAAINDSSYKIVLMGAPAIIPRGNKFAYDAGMRRIRNCPFNGPDADYVDDVLLPKLNSTMEAVAHQENIDFINLHNAFDKHRLCESGLGKRVTGALPVNSLNTEWVRYLDTTGLSFNAFAAAIAKWADLADGTTIGYVAGDQGTLAESLHPNEFGQRALGDCLRAYHDVGNVASRGFKCTAGVSGHASDMKVNILSAPPTITSYVDSAIPDNSSLSIHKTFSSSAQPGNVMRIELKINHAKKGQLAIKMLSPSGKSYVIKQFNPTDTGAFPSVYKSFYFNAPAESGTWSLKIEDKVAGVTGTFLDWKAYFY